MSKLGKMDPLAGLDDDDDIEGSSSGSEAEEEQAGGSGKPAAEPAAKKQKQTLTLEDLRAHGYQGGPSVLFVPDKQEHEQSWAWDSGAAHKKDEVEEESFEERQANREAVGEKAEASAVYARKAVHQAELLRQQRREEQDALKKKKQFTWNQKEKRKREEGKASRGRSYVEEEKRRAREFGIVSGFD